jgi:hypothetical protein
MKYHNTKTENKPFGVKCTVYGCGFEWYKGSPMTDEELKEHRCIHFLDLSNTDSDIKIVFRYKDGSYSDPMGVENKDHKKIDTIEVYKGKKGEETIIGFITYEIPQHKDGE